jgi:hypothetical protein
MSGNWAVSQRQASLPASKPPAARGSDRELRADARRNRERVLRTAQQVFAAAEFDLRTAAPDVAANLTRQVADLLGHAQTAHAVRDDVTVEEVMALVAGAFAAIRHAGAETSRQRSAHIAQLILDGLRPQSR